ncbi:MAG: hypothetical protein ACPL1K_03490, partial [Candidatus Kryptoniota bacterium]
MAADATLMVPVVEPPLTPLTTFPETAREVSDPRKSIRALPELTRSPEMLTAAEYTWISAPEAVRAFDTEPETFRLPVPKMMSPPAPPVLVIDPVLTSPVLPELKSIEPLVLLVVPELFVTV